MTTSDWLLWSIIQTGVDQLIYASLGSRYSVTIVADASFHPDSVEVRLFRKKADANSEYCNVYQLALPYQIARLSNETDSEVVTRLTASLFNTLVDFDGGAAKRKLVQPVSRVYGLAAIIDGHEE